MGQSLYDLLKARQPGHTLPREMYRSPEVLTFDLDTIFGKEWLQVGFEAEIGEVGSWITVDFGETSIILVRSASDRIAGFHNSCRHRGARICNERHGKTPGRLICPYHQWTYSLDGRLVAAPLMGASFEKSTHGLRPIAVETVEGVIFVCLSENPPDFAHFRNDLAPFLRPYHLRDGKIAHVAVLDEAANWKLVMENARECYHCKVQHPQLMRSLPDVTEFTKSSVPPAIREYHTQCEAAGTPAGPVHGDWYEIFRYPLADGARSITLAGELAVKRKLGPLEATLAPGALRWATQPNSFAHVFEDYALLFCAYPTGPQRTNVVAKWLVHKDAQEGIDYTLSTLTEVWNVTNDQDRWLSENNQRGVNANGYTPGPYAPVEATLLEFVDWYHARCLSALEPDHR
jgi:glycine betaine catabolism A